jgi:FMN phosphatase YigB (HAD superfamily)
MGGVLWAPKASTISCQQTYVHYGRDTRMIKAVLWDLGDVLCRFHPDRRVREIARYSGASEDDVRALLTPQLLGRLDAGDMTGDELLTTVHVQLKWHCTVADLGYAWAVAFEPDDSVLTLARRLVVPAALLTNNGQPLSDHFRQLLPGVAEVIPTSLFSGHTRLVKPAPSSFSNACVILNTVPSDVLLIDDSPANIAAASGEGLRTHLYRSAKMLETFLDREHLLDSGPAPA